MCCDWVQNLDPSQNVDVDNLKICLAKSLFNSCQLGWKGWPWIKNVLFLQGITIHRIDLLLLSAFAPIYASYQDVVNHDGLSPLSLAARYQLWDMFTFIFEVHLSVKHWKQFQVIFNMRLYGLPVPIGDNSNWVGKICRNAIFTRCGTMEQSSSRNTTSPIWTRPGISMTCSSWGCGQSAFLESWLLLRTLGVGYQRMRIKSA